VAGLSIGKTESGVVSVSSLLADEKIHWPVNFEPYTPAHHFEGGKEDPKFHTKLKIAAQLVEQSVEEGIPFRAVVADSFYGEDEGFKQSLSELLGVGYVMALKPSHAWWHKIGEIGSPYEAAVAASEGWEDEKRSGEWVKVVRRFWGRPRGGVVGSGGGCGIIRSPKSPAVGCGHHRSAEAAREGDVVLGY
jgi:hypothetical protein